MRFLTGEPYSKREVPTVKGSASLAAWADKLSAFLGYELGSVQRGSARASSRRVTSATTASVNDGLILADATGGAFAVTLPAPESVADMCVTIKRMNAGANAVTVGGTVDGTLNRTLGSQYAAMTVWAYAPAGDPAQWVRVAVV